MSCIGIFTFHIIPAPMDLHKSFDGPQDCPETVENCRETAVRYLSGEVSPALKALVNRIALLARDASSLCTDQVVEQ